MDGKAALRTYALLFCAFLALEMPLLEFASFQGISTICVDLDSLTVEDLRAAADEDRIVVSGLGDGELLRFKTTLYSEEALDRPPYDTRVDAHIGSIRVHYHHRFFMPVVDFATEFLDVFNLVAGEQYGFDACVQYVNLSLTCARTALT